MDVPADSAPDDRIYRKRSILAIIVLSVNFGIVFFDRNSLNFLMPFVSGELKLDTVEIGALAAALSFTWAVSGFVVGLASDRANSRKPLLLGAILIFSLSSIVSGLATSFALLLGARLLMGAAEGPILPLSQSMIAAIAPPRARGLAMGIVQNFGSNLLGAFFAPIILVSLATWFGWRATFLLTGLPGLLCALAVWKLVDEPPAAHEAGSARTRLSPAEVLRSRNIVVCCILSVLIVGYFAITYTFLPIYLTRSAGYSTGGMSWLIALLGLSAATAGFVVPALSDRLGRRPVMIGVPLLGILLPIGALAGPSSVALLGLLLFVGWLTIGTLSLVMATIPSETVAPDQVATMLAIVMGAGEIVGGVIGPLVTGYVAADHGLVSSMWILLSLAVASSATSIALKETLPASDRLRA